MEKTRLMLLEHYHKYPKLQIQDIFKFIYQSSFGCEHLVTDLVGATEYIKKEYELIDKEDEPYIDALDGEYSRVSLSYLHKGLRIDTFAKIFVLSSKKEIDGLSNLLHKIEVALKLVDEGLLPFDKEEFNKCLLKWKEMDYPAIHHSNIFRENYKPAYRVISNKYIPFLNLLIEIDKRMENEKVVLCIEGGSASGKSTLGDMLSSIYDLTLLHMDDFFLQPHQRSQERLNEIGGNIDYERFLNEVLIHLKNGEEINYRRFDCSKVMICEGISIKPKRLTIIEGAYSMHPLFDEYYDLKVFLDISSKLQKERILKRNSLEFANRFFNEWIPLENFYFSKTNVKGRSDLIIKID